MVKLKQFEITYKNKDGVCFAGSPLEGAVVVELTSKMKVKEIRLRFHGYAMVHWTERHSTGTGKNKRTVVKHFTGEELYFDHTVVIYGSQNGECENFQPGLHTFPFEFHVPEACPTSYEGTLGRIRYCVMATIEKMFSVSQSVISGFSVVNNLNLNHDSRTQECIEAQNEMTLCCMCCKSGPITARLSLDNIGFVPGEGIPIRAEITNQSSRKIVSLEAVLKMNVKYNASKKTKSHCNVVASTSKTNLRSSDKCLIWADDKLTVPAVPPSFVNGCGIIDISYILELSVNPSGPSFDLPVKIEVIIGTIPLKTFPRKASVIAQRETIMENEEQQGTEIKRRESRINQENGNMATFVSDNSVKRNSLVRRESLTENSGKRNSIVRRDSIIPGENGPVMGFMKSILGSVSLENEMKSDSYKSEVKFTPLYPYYNYSQSDNNFQTNLQSRRNSQR